LVFGGLRTFFSSSLPFWDKEKDNRSNGTRRKGEEEIDRQIDRETEIERQTERRKEREKQCKI